MQSAVNGPWAQGMWPFCCKSWLSAKGRPLAFVPPFSGSPDRQLLGFGIHVRIGRDACALWSLGAGAAAGCRCQTCGRARFGAWVLLLLPGAWPCALFAWVLVGCCRVLLQGAAARGLWPFALWGAGAIGGRCRVSLQGAAARCLWQCAASSCTLVLLLWCCPQISFTICGPMLV